MLEKLSEVEKHFDEISDKLFDPNIISDMEQYKSLMKEQKTLSPIVEKYREYKKAESDLEEAKQMLDDGGLDKEMREMVLSEIEDGKAKVESLTEELKILLLPKDPNDDKNVIVEIRGGAGGEESALFAAVLFRMYSMYAEKKGFKTEVLYANDTELGGFKEISFMISGEGAYSRL